MSYPIPGSQTELQAINQILMSIGQAPVTTLERTNPDVAISWDTLMEVSREVQSEGWTFNREYDVPQPLNGNNEIEIADDVLQIDVSCNRQYYKGKQYDTVRRGSRLYDRRNHTYKFDETLYCDMKYLWPWDELPPPIKSYIVARASSIVSSRLVGDPNQYQILQQKEGYMRAMALEYETQQGDYNFMQDPRYEENYRHYQPMDVLRRY